MCRHILIKLVTIKFHKHATGDSGTAAFVTSKKKCKPKVSWLGQCNILGLPYVQIATIPFKVAKFRGHTPGLASFPVSRYCPAPPAIQLVSPHPRLFVITINLAFIFCYDFRKQVYDLLTHLAGPCIQKFRSVSGSRAGEVAQILQPSACLHLCLTFRHRASSI